MLDLSFWELIVIALACIIFLKPEDIPEILKQTGKFFRKVKNGVDEITSVLKEEKTVKTRSKVLGLDGKYHDAYDVREVFPEAENPVKKDE